MVLYINGNYPHHSLHRELVSKLADLGHEVCVYIPMRGSVYAGKNDLRKQGVGLVYSDVLSLADRIFFLGKIRKIAGDIEKKIDMTAVDCIIAGTVYSDGMPAYLLSRKYGIPFSVVVRNTDINTHMKWRPYLNACLKRLLQTVSKVVFISPVYQANFAKYGLKQGQCVCIPNAINDFWFQYPDRCRDIHDPLSMVYVGEISDNKNLQTSIRVIRELGERKIDAELHIVGSGDREEECRQLAKRSGLERKIHFYGWKNGLSEIKAYYDQADIFIMPSFKETFGTVYIEALSQGLPVIYTRGQGIDGYFEQGKVGYACDPANVTEIADSVQKIVSNYSELSLNSCTEARRFRWDIIANAYSSLINCMRKYKE